MQNTYTFGGGALIVGEEMPVPPRAWVQGAGFRFGIWGLGFRVYGILAFGFGLGSRF